MAAKRVRNAALPAFFPDSDDDAFQPPPPPPRRAINFDALEAPASAAAADTETADAQQHFAEAAAAGELTAAELDDVFDDTVQPLTAAEQEQALATLRQLAARYGLASPQQPKQSAPPPVGRGGADPPAGPPPASPPPLQQPYGVELDEPDDIEAALGPVLAATAEADLADVFADPRLFLTEPAHRTARREEVAAFEAEASRYAQAPAQTLDAWITTWGRDAATGQPLRVNALPPNYLCAMLPVGDALFAACVLAGAPQPLFRFVGFFFVQSSESHLIDMQRQGGCAPPHPPAAPRAADGARSAIAVPKLASVSDATGTVPAVTPKPAAPMAKAAPVAPARTKTCPRPTAPAAAATSSLSAAASSPANPRLIVNHF